MCLNLFHIFKLGQTDILEQIHHQTNLVNEITLKEIVSAGNIDTIQWYFDKTAYRLFFRKHIINGSVIRWAIKAHHLSVLKWIASVTQSLPYKEATVGHVIATGDINMLEWVQTVKWVEVIEWHTVKEVEARIINTDALWSAAKHGYIHVLAWLQQNQFLLTSQNKWIVHGAIVGGQIHVLKWLGKDAIKLAFEDVSPIVGLAIKYNWVYILAIFNEYQFIDQAQLYQITIFDTKSYYQFKSDPYPLLQWLRRHCYHFHTDAIFCWAIHHDAWHIVEWLLQENLDIASLPHDLREKLQRYQHFCQLLKS